MKAALLALLVLSLPLAAQAKYLTPELLYEDINSGDPVRYNRAYGYIIGVYDSFEGVIYTHHENLKPEELVDVVDRFIKAHREEHYYSAQLMVLKAIEGYVKEKEAERMKEQERKAP